MLDLAAPAQALKRRAGRREKVGCRTGKLRTARGRAARPDARRSRSEAPLPPRMQPTVARTGGACGWATANGAALPPPSQAALARAASVLAAPAAPVRSLSESLVGTGLMLVRMRAVCAPHSALTGQPVARDAYPPRLQPRRVQLHPDQGLVAVYGVVPLRDGDETSTQGAPLRTPRRALLLLCRSSARRTPCSRSAVLRLSAPRRRLCAAARRRRQAVPRGVSGRTAMCGCALPRRRARAIRTRSSDARVCYNANSTNACAAATRRACITRHRARA